MSEIIGVHACPQCGKPLVAGTYCDCFVGKLKEAIIRREHATPAQVEGRMSDERLTESAMRVADNRLNHDQQVDASVVVLNEARRARDSESALLARAEADARRVAELERENRNENEAHALFAHATDNKIRALESELARLRDHLHEEHACNCDEAARQGLAPTSAAAQAREQGTQAPDAPQAREEDSEPELTPAHVANLRRWTAQVREDHRHGRPVTVFEYAALLLFEYHERRLKDTP